LPYFYYFEKCLQFLAFRNKLAEKGRNLTVDPHNFQNFRLRR